jgi:3-phosphoglycerate kinase
MLKHIKDIDIKNKRVLLRCDLNVPFDDKFNILDDYRIIKSIPTIKFLSDNGAKVVIISHLSGKKDKTTGKEQNFSIEFVAKKLAEVLDKKVLFINDTIGAPVEKAIEQMEFGDIILLENIRFYKEEEENSNIFADRLANLADMYVNDAFGVSHRAHASVNAITRYIPSYAGFLLFEEISNMEKVLQNPEKPLVAIIGGAKLETKIGVIEKFLQIADHVLVGGDVANAILQGKGLTTSGTMPDQKVIDQVNKIDITNTKLHLPVDAVACLKEGDSEYMRKTSIGAVRKEEKIFDIGPDTIGLYSSIIKVAKTVFFNGPMGLIENKDYVFGTLEVCKSIVESKAYSIVGGGESNSFLKDVGLINKFSYASTGGGAMLEFVSGVQLPGLKALGYYD